MLAGEITGQRARLEDDYAAVSNDFVDVFDDLDDRIKWHRFVLVAVSGLAIVGALVATVAFLMLTEVGSARCLVGRSEEHTSELQSLMRISYAVFCLKKKKKRNQNTQKH